MKKFLIMATLTVGCIKSGEERISDEVRITVTNSCVAKIKMYRPDSSYLAYVFDCGYNKILSVKIEQGKYKLVADNYRGRKKEMWFVKGKYQQNLDIEF